MAEAGTIIDAFLIEVGLDPKKFQDGRKKVSEDFKRLRDDTSKTGKGVEETSKKMAASVGALRNEVLRMTLAFAGASSLTGFAKNLVESDANAGRLAGNIGMITSELGAWEGAIQRVGGKASDVDNSLRAMTQAFWDMQLTGRTQNDAAFRQFGLTPADIAKGPAEMLLKISEASEKMSRPQFYARAKFLGLDDSTILLLEKGRDGVEKLLEEQRKLGPATEESARKAQELQDKLAKLKTAIEGEARPSIMSLVDWLLKLTGDTKDSEKALDELSLILVPLAIGAAAAGAPFVALAAAIGAVAANWRDLKSAWNSADSWWKSVTDNMGSDTLHDFFLSGFDKNRDAIWGKSSSGGSKPVKPTPAQTAAASKVLGGMSGGLLSTGTGGTDPEIYRALAAKYGAERAAGITAGIKAEGGSLGMSANGAFGIGQWRGDRQKELFRRYGYAPSKAEQLEFLMWELEGGDKGGASVMASKDRYSALSNYIGGYGWGFMRPSTKTDNSGRIGDMRRGYAALRSLEGRHPSPASANVNIGSMTINTRATDANGIARDIRESISRRVVINQVNGGLH